MRTIFVFGSNLAGIHGAGAAWDALQQYGAILGRGWGLQGDSYAIPTKDEEIQTLPLPIIATYVKEFLTFARRRPKWLFEVTAIGCGLAGYTPKDIAPMFRNAPPNCILPDRFRDVLGDI